MAILVYDPPSNQLQGRTLNCCRTSVETQLSPYAMYTSPELHPCPTMLILPDHNSTTQSTTRLSLRTRRLRPQRHQSQRQPSARQPWFHPRCWHCHSCHPLPAMENRPQSCRCRPARNPAIPFGLSRHRDLRNLHRRRVPPQQRRPKRLHSSTYRCHCLYDMDSSYERSRRISTS